MTWVYDSANDSIIWSSPIEELFGFEAGVRGFSVLRDDGDRDRRRSTPPPMAPAGDSLFADGDRHRRGLAGAHPGAHPPGPAPADFDLRMVVECPDGIAHSVVVRASPIARPR